MHRFLRAFLHLCSSVFIYGSLSCSDRSRVDAVWAGGGRGQGELVYPRAIDYDANTNTFVVVDRTARVQRYDHAGKYLNGWRMPEWERGKPVGITVGPDGNFWIADTHYHRVMVYTPQGQIVKQFGTRGAGNGEFELPTDIAFSSDGLVYVSEYGGHDRIQVFDQNGVYQFQFGSFGNDAEQFSRPQSMRFVKTPRGEELFVTDSCNHRLQVWSKEGKHLRNIGQSGSAPGAFRFPYGLSLDADGNLVVTEYGNARVQRLTPDGTPIDTWGRAGRLPGELAYPWDTAIDQQGRAVLIDAGNNRMQVFRF